MIAENEPAEQASQLLLSAAAANWPAVQSVQLLPPSLERVPAGQASQLLPPATAVNLPAVQSVQLLLLSGAANLPAGQASQVTRSWIQYVKCAFHSTSSIAVLPKPYTPLFTPARWKWPYHWPLDVLVLKWTSLVVAAPRWLPP